MNKLKTYLFLILGIFYVLLSVVLVVYKTSIDGVDVFKSIFLLTDTVYAAGYSDESFRRIEHGMTMKQVHDILGPPLVESDHDGFHFEDWSKSPRNRHYRHRSLVFQEGKVVVKYVGIY